MCPSCLRKNYSIYMAIISLQLTSVFRDCIAEDLFNGTQGYQIGGPGCTVEVDESMFGGGTFCLLQIRILGKRKYQRGRITGRRQQWILGGVCRSHTFSLNVYIVSCVGKLGNVSWSRSPRTRDPSPSWRLSSWRGSVWAPRSWLMGISATRGWRG